MCLILVGLFFAAPLYRMNLLTIGDYYKKKFGRSVEVLTTIAIVISYLGWVGAQITALGLVFNVVSGGEISKLGGHVDRLRHDPRSTHSSAACGRWRSPTSSR